MTEVRLTLTISQQSPRLLTLTVQRQFRQMELQLAISVNNHLQDSHYSMIRYNVNPLMPEGNKKVMHT